MFQFSLKRLMLAVAATAVALAALRHVAGIGDQQLIVFFVFLGVTLPILVATGIGSTSLARVASKCFEEKNTLTGFVALAGSFLIGAMFACAVVFFFVAMIVATNPATWD